VVHIHNADDLDDLSTIPTNIQVELLLIKEAIEDIYYSSVIIAPLYALL